MTATQIFVRPAQGRVGLVRFLAGYVAVLGTLPYLTLKTAWLTGSTVGITDPSFAGDGGLFVLNTVTAGMDAVAVVMALTFTHRWGQRAPAWVVLVPMFVGTGLLVPIAVGAPLAFLAGLVAGTPELASSSLPLAPWVQPMVYGGFAIQGVALLTAFTLDARVRWVAALSPVGPCAADTGTDTDTGLHAARTTQAAVANGGALLAAVLGGMNLVWAFGGTAGLGERVAAAQTLASSLMNGVHGALALIAAAGALATVHGARVPRWLPVTAAWVGSASLLSWGLWSTINVLGGTVLVGGAGGMALVDLHSLGKVIAGLVIALTSLFCLAQRQATEASR